MRFLNFRTNESLVPGVVSGDHVIDLVSAWADPGLPPPLTMKHIIERPGGYLPAIEKLLRECPPDAPARLPESGLAYGPAVSGPGKILCVGLNYRNHAAETGMPIPETPVLFGKFANTIAASGQNIDISGFNKVDYESELAVVMGRTARHVTEPEALSTVFGYCIANDLSDRELQRRTAQWLLGKTPDHFCPIGPYLVTRDEVPDPQALAIRGWLNGQLRQDSHTSDMIFSVAEIISYASRYFTLEPGDIILTGTPAGVIMGRDEKEWMKDGDEYVVEIDRLGRLANCMVARDRLRRL